MMLRPLPELPIIEDPSAPSAPPETDLRDVDPEQAGFAALLKRTFQRCLQVSAGSCRWMWEDAAVGDFEFPLKFSVYTYIF